MQSARSLLRILKRPVVKRTLVLGVIIVTIVTFVSFFYKHPQYFRSLRQVDPLSLALIIGLYSLMLAILAAMYRVQLQLCSARVPTKENILLTAYSTLANFFGPLQSGPGARAVYLKTKHNDRLRDYIVVSLIYYGVFACFSAFFLLVGTRPWWQTALGSLAALALSAGVIQLFRNRDTAKDTSQLNLQPQLLAQLILLTFLQVLLTGIIYYVELHAIHARVSVGQALCYAGAANFALFVSLTPGAIGFRESFLYFSSQLHHVSTANIFAASLVDRGAYVLFLGLLFIVVVGTHTKDRLLRQGRQ